MDSIFKVSLVLDMIDNLTGKAKGVNTSISGIAQSFDTLQGAGKAMTGLGAGIMGALGGTVTATFDTQNALGEIASLGVENLQAIESAAKGFSDTWAGTSKADFISASYDIKSGIASLTDEGIAQFTELAALTGKATKSTTDTMGSLFATGYGIYKGYYDELSDLEFGEMFSAGIATAVKNYKTSGSEMASAISMLGATATNANIPMEEQLAILGQLQTTMSGSEAATKYKAFLNTAAGAGKKLGLTFLDTNNQLLSMPEILDTLRGKYGDTLDAVEKQQLKEAFGTDEAIALIDLLYQNTDQLKTGIDDLQSSMSNGVSVTEEMAAAINNTPERKFEVVKQKIHNATEELGKGLLPTVNSALDVVGSVIQRGSDWVASNQDTVASIMHIVMYLGIFLIAAGALTAVIGTVGKTFGSLGGIVGGVKKVLGGSGFLSALGPFALIAAAVGGLIALFQACGGDVSQLQGIMSKVFGAFGGIVSNALTAIGQYLPGFLQFGLDLLMQLTAGIIGGLPSLLDAGTSMITSVTSGMSAALPGILTSASNVLLNFLTMILAGLPGIMSSGSQMMAALVLGLAQMLPGIAEAAAQIINSFLTMLVAALPGLLSAGVGMVTTLLDGIIQALPAVIASGIQLMLGLLDGIAQNLPGILAAGVTLVALLLSGIAQMLPNLITGGLAIIGNLISGILQAVPTLLGMIPDIFANVGTAIMDIDWLGIGGDMIAGIKDGFMSGFKSLVDSVKGAWGKFKDWLSGGGSEEEAVEVVSNPSPAAAAPAIPQTDTAAYELPKSPLPTTAAMTEQTVPVPTTVEIPEITFDASQYQTIGIEGMEAYASGLQVGSFSAQGAADGAASAIMESLGGMDTSGIESVGADIMGSLGAGMEGGAADTASAAQAAVQDALASVNAGSGLTSGISMDMSGLSGITSAVTAQVGTAQAASQSGISEMEAAWSSGMASVQSAASSGMAKVKRTVSSAASQAAAAIRNAFANLSVTVPAPKLPHISVSYATVGSGEASAQVPNFSVQYYAKGAVLTRPTMFGINGSKQMVGGEAGDEAILPVDTLWGKMKEVVTSVVSQPAARQEKEPKARKRPDSGKAGNKYFYITMNVDASTINDLKKLKGVLDELDEPEGTPQMA